MKLNAIYDNIKTLLVLIRVRNALIALLGVYVGAILYTPTIQFDKILLAGISAAFILGGGNIINDYFDIETDKTNKPWRPLPSSKITMSDTIMLSVVFFMTGLGLANAVNKYCLIIAAINSITLLLYGRYSKKLLLISNLSISYLVASIFIYGAIATIGLSHATADGKLLLFVVVTCSFFMTFSREIVKDIEDVEGDSKVYATSLPIQIGEKHSNQIALALGTIAILASLIPFTHPTAGFNNIVYAPIILLADIIFAASFTMHPAMAQRIMVAGMTLSLVAFLVGRLVPI